MNRRGYRFRFGAVLVLALALLAVACARQPAAPSAPTPAPAAQPAPSPQPQTPPNLGKITLGLSVAKTFEFLPAYVAQDIGSWKKRGLEVEIVTFPGDARLHQAFAANAIQVGLGSATGAATAIAKGLETRVIAAISNTVGFMGLVAHPSIQKPEDLKGKTVGVTSPNALTDILVKYLSRKLTGDPEGGIKRAHLGAFENQVAALKTGQTQAFTWTLDGIFEVEKQGIGKFLLSFGDHLPPIAFEVIIAQKSLVDQKPEVVKAFLEGFFEAVAKMKQDKNYTLAIFKQKMEVSEDVGSKVYDFDIKNVEADGRIVDEAFNNAAQLSVDAGSLPSRPPLEAWVDKRFVPVKLSK